MSKFLKNYGKFIVLIVGVLATAFLLFNAFKINGAEEASSGIDVIFGSKEKVGNVSVDIFKFNFMLFVAMLIPAVAGILTLLIKNKNVPLLGVILFAASIVILLLTKNTEMNILIGTTKVSVELAVMGWFSVVFSGIGLLTSVGLLIENK